MIGLVLGGTSLFGKIADIGGNIYKDIFLPRSSISTDNSLQVVLDLITELMHTPRPEGQTIQGIGVGVQALHSTRRALSPGCQVLGGGVACTKDMLIDPILE